MTATFTFFLASVSVFAIYLCSVSCRRTGPKATEYGLMECATSFELPRATDGLDPNWFGAGSESTVTADFEITAEGRATEVTVSGRHQELGNLTWKYIMLSTFSTHCRGRKMRVVFEYKIVHQPAAVDLPAFTLHNNNRIRMVFAEKVPSGPLRAVPR